MLLLPSTISQTVGVIGIVVCMPRAQLVEPLPARLPTTVLAPLPAAAVGSVMIGLSQPLPPGALAVLPPCP
jgi:hypothetical protein